MSLLSKADTTQQQREASRTHPFIEFGLIARLWSAYLNIEILPSDVALLMVLLKTAREKLNPSEEHRIDMAGYAQALDKLEAVVMQGELLEEK